MKGKKQCSPKRRTLRAGNYVVDAPPGAPLRWSHLVELVEQYRRQACCDDDPAIVVDVYGPEESAPSWGVATMASGHVEGGAVVLHVAKVRGRHRLEQPVEK